MSGAGLGTLISNDHACFATYRLRVSIEKLGRLPDVSPIAMTSSFKYNANNNICHGHTLLEVSSNFPPALLLSRTYPVFSPLYRVLSSR